MAGLSVDWDINYRTIDDRSRATAQEAFLHNLRRGEAYQAEAPGLWDVTFQTAVAQAELEARDYPGALPPGRLPRPGRQRRGGAHRDHPPRAAPGVRGPDRPPRRRAVCRRCSAPRSPRRCSASRCPSLAHPLAETDKGAGIAMCCTFGDLTDVQWWRELRLPTRSVVHRDGRIQAETPEWITAEPGRALFAEMAAKTMFSRAHRGGRRAARPPATWPASRRPPSARRTSTRRATARSRSSPRASGTSATAAATPTCASSPRCARRGARLPPRVHAHPLRELGRRPQRRLADQPAALLRRADPRLVPHRRRRARSTTTTRSCPTPSALPVDPAAEPPAGYDEAQRGAPGGFHRRPRRHGHVGHLLADPEIAGGWRDDPELFAKVFPMDHAPAGARHHPDLAVLHRGPLAPGVRHAAVEARDDQRLDPRPRPQEDEQVQGQRHHADRHAARARQRRDPLLGGLGPARHRRGAGHRPDEGRPAPGHQGAQREQVRAVLRRDRRRGRRPRPRW